MITVYTMVTHTDKDKDGTMAAIWSVFVKTLNMASTDAKRNVLMWSTSHLDANKLKHKAPAVRKSNAQAPQVPSLGLKPSLEPLVVIQYLHQ